MAGEAGTDGQGTVTTQGSDAASTETTGGSQAQAGGSGAGNSASTTGSADLVKPVAGVNESRDVDPITRAAAADPLAQARQMFESQIPEGYKEKYWVQNLLNTDKPWEELFKQNDNAQTALGKRPVVPGADATPEQIKEFHKQLGVPDTADGYQIAPTQWSEEDKAIGEYLNAARNESFMAKIKAKAHELGVAPKVLQGLVDTYDQAFAVEHKAAVLAQIDREVNLAKDFDAQADKYFGARKADVVAKGNELINASVPPEMKAAVAGLDNNAQMVLAATLDMVYKRYVKEDGMAGTGANTGNAGRTNEDISAEGRRLMALPAFSDITHADHERVNKQVKELYKSLR